MAIVTIFALISYYVTPEEAWLPKARLVDFVQSTGTDSIQQHDQEHDQEPEGELRAGTPADPPPLDHK